RWPRRQRPDQGQLLCIIGAVADIALIEQTAPIGRTLAIDVMLATLTWRSCAENQQAAWCQVATDRVAEYGCSIRWQMLGDFQTGDELEPPRSRQPIRAAYVKWLAQIVSDEPILWPIDNVYTVRLNTQLAGHVHHRARARA